MKKGFTLIELLAVIVILALIALISVPLVLGVIDKVQKSSYKESLRSVFGAADLFIAGNGFDVFPDDGINVMDDRIKMKNKGFTSGKILKNEDGILELDKVSNGKYCAGGTYKEIIIIEGSCDQLDTTPPVLSITSNLVTSSSITIVATAEDLESGINGYQFSKDNGTTWTSKQISNVYNFTGLTNNTNYTFKVRVYNNNELSTVSEELIVRTNDIAIPTYSINTTDWTHEKIVTIHYPERQAGFVYEYSLDGATTWLLVESPSTTKEITFTDNGSVIARITDGTNEISGTSYQVTNIDKVDPTVSMNVVGSPFNANGWSKTNFDINIETTDLESGISNYKYCQTTSSSCTPSTTVNNASGVVTITTESATNKVCVQAYDNANNSSEVVCTNSYKLDKTSPTAGTISLSGTLGSNGWYTSNVTVNKTDGSDTLSGHATTTLSHTSITSETTGITVTLTTTDQAGNTATRTELVKVDKTAPIAGTISLSGTLGTNGWYRSNVTVSKTDGSDTISGHASTTLSHTSITTDTSGVTITLTTTNNAGLTSTATQTVKVDKTAPIINLIGSDSITINLGTVYNDAGANATDLHSGISASVTTSGTVNTNVAGTYIISYNVSDNAGNAAVTKTRTVKVLAPYTITNMIRNGGYENGSSYWSLSRATVVSDVKYEGSYSLRFDSYAEPSAAMSMQTLTHSAPIYGHKYYGSVMFLSTTGFTTYDNRYEWYYADTAGALLVFANKSNSTTNWIRLSNITTLSNNDYVGNNWYIRNFIRNSNAYSYTDNLILVDLTATFGAGNEPDLTWCNNNIGYFEGNATVYK